METDRSKRGADSPGESCSGGFVFLQGSSLAAAPTVADIRAQELAETICGRRSCLDYISIRYAVIKAVFADLEQLPASFGKALASTTRAILRWKTALEDQICPRLECDFAPTAPHLRTVVEANMELAGHYGR